MVAIHPISTQVDEKLSSIKNKEDQVKLSNQYKPNASNTLSFKCFREKLKQNKDDFATFLGKCYNKDFIAMIGDSLGRLHGGFYTT